MSWAVPCGTERWTQTQALEEVPESFGSNFKIVCKNCVTFGQLLNPGQTNWWAPSQPLSPPITDSFCGFSWKDTKLQLYAKSAGPLRSHANNVQRAICSPRVSRLSFTVIVRSVQENISPWCGRCSPSSLLHVSSYLKSREDAPSRGKEFFHRCGWGGSSVEGEP